MPKIVNGSGTAVVVEGKISPPPEIVLLKLPKSLLLEPLVTKK
ncbi:hypothetical protein [Chamaesiphon sp. GL140_3_metabinner_50]|nr:hypothetical protein [Chamaesiphon sp. GL140_3_metabinner_50]